MNETEVLRITKQISELQSKKAACVEVAMNSTNFTDLIAISKKSHQCSKQIIYYNNLLDDPALSAEDEEAASSEEYGTLRIQALRLSLLWSDDSKKKDSITGFAYFLIQHGEQFIDSDIVEFDAGFCEIFCPVIKVPDVNLNGAIHVSAFYLWINPAVYLKSPSKTKEHTLLDPCLKFSEIGSAKIRVRELTRIDTPIYDFKLQPEDQSTILNTSSSLSTPSSKRASTSSLAKLKNSKKNTLSGQFFGSRLTPWYLTSGLFTFFPNNLVSEFCQFGCLVDLEGFSKTYFFLFEKQRLNMYPHQEYYMCHPLRSINLEALNFNQVSVLGHTVTMYDASDHASLEFLFATPELASRFVDYLHCYVRSFQLWGKNIDVQMDQKTACHVILDIVLNPSSLPLYLKMDNINPITSSDN